MKAKKPWAVAAAALLLVGLTINYFGHYWSVLSADVKDPAMDSALKAADAEANKAKGLASDLSNLKDSFDKFTKVGNELQSNIDGRLLWLEVLKAIDASLPKDARPIGQKKETEEDIAKRPELHIESIDCEYFADLTPWLTSPPVASNMKNFAAPAAPAANGQTPAGAAPAGPGVSAADAAAATPPPGGAPPAGPPATPPATPDATVPPTGDAAAGQTTDASGAPAGAGGWVIEIRGHHFHNNLPDKNVNVGDEGEQFVTNTLVKNLATGKVKLPDGPNGQLIDVPIADLGIKHPVVVIGSKVQTVAYMAEPIDATAQGGLMMGPRRRRRRRRIAVGLAGANRSGAETIHAASLRFHRAIQLGTATARRSAGKDGQEGDRRSQHRRRRRRPGRAQLVGVRKSWTNCAPLSTGSSSTIFGC